jgi:hypothetical protein
MSIVNRTSILRVIALEISEDGAVSKKQMKIDRDSQLENTLLKADYPDIRVATIDIPQQQLDQYQQAPDPEGQAIDDLARRVAEWEDVLRKMIADHEVEPHGE